MNKMKSVAWLMCSVLVSTYASARTEKLQAPTTTSATLKVLEVPGQDAVCRNLLDVQFTIANADVAGEGFYTQYPQWDEKLKGNAEFQSFVLQRMDGLYREAFTEDERKELDNMDELNSAIMMMASEEDIKDDSTFPPLVKRYLKFKTTVFRTAADEYTTKRVASIESRNQDVLDALDAREDTDRLSDGKTFRTTNDAFRQHYVHQRSAETCYAASLLTVWKYYGWTADYRDFVDQRAPRCELSSSRRPMASFNEIISTVYHLRTKSDFALFTWSGSKGNAKRLAKIQYTQTLKMGILAQEWSYAYLGRSPLNNLLIGVISPATLWSPLDPNTGANNDTTPNLYQQFGWHQTSNPSIQGAVTPLLHTGHIVLTILRGDALLVGLSTEDGGHTALVTGIEYEPQFYVQNDAPVYGPSTRIRRIRLLDPGPLVEPERWRDDVDRFLGEYRFGIAIHQDR